MEAYTSFASVYDVFMDNVPYEEWGKYLCGLLREYGAESGLILDLGCGTGAMTEILAGYGYDMIGVDNSEEMLEQGQVPGAGNRQKFSDALNYPQDDDHYIRHR